MFLLHCYHLPPVNDATKEIKHTHFKYFKPNLRMIPSFEEEGKKIKQTNKEQLISIHKLRK